MLVVPKVVEEVFLGRRRGVAIAPDLSGVVVFEFGGEDLQKITDMVGGLIGEFGSEQDRVEWMIHRGTPMSELC